MPARFKQIIIILFYVILQGPNPAYAEDNESDASLMPEASMNERVLNVPGDSERPVVLQLTVLTPSGPGPFPLVVMNHGSDGKKKPRDNPRYHLTFSAYYFLSRGYAVALPMMRGYAGSGGQLEHHGCDFISTGVNNAKDIRAVIQYMTAQPYIDGHRIVVAGQSFGGFNTLAFGTLNFPNVKGLINFAGGLRASDCPTSEQSMAEAAAYIGAHTTIPSIWFYGSNDKVFSESTWRTAYEGYTAAGGPAKLVAYGNFMDNSHNLLGFPEGLAIWGPKVDTFLAQLGLPNKPIYPEYLPLPAPLPTQYAALDDVGAVPFLNDQGRQQYRNFLTQPMPRAFFIGENGGSASTHGGFDPLGAGFRACKSKGTQCYPYAVDNEVVWVKPPSTPVPPATHFAALEDTNAVPYINEQGRQTYQQFLAKPLPRAFLIAGDGTSVATQGGLDPLGRGLADCKKAGRNCRPYAVDNTVVWVQPARTPPPTHFAALEDATAVPYLSTAAREGYRKFLALKKPRAFTIAPDGAWSAAAGGNEPLQAALDACATAHRDCRPYAVDDQVVWSKK
jgi:dienelactone hydrolase